MPKISVKGLNMPASPIRKLVPYADKAKKEGKKIYHLNIGQPDIETPETFLNAVKNTQTKIIEYTHSAGYESYRKKLVDYYAGYKIRLGIDDIIVTNGGSEAIQIAMMVCLNAGDELIIPEPFYANFNCFAFTADVVIKPVKSSIESGFALPPVSDIEKLIGPKTKGIMICNPGNPTGYLYTREELEQLKQLAVKHDLFLFSDEVYREFCYDNSEYASIMHLEGVDDRLVMLDSISKRFSACGARIGALICKNKEVIASAMKFAQARLSPPTLEQIGAEAALDTPKEYIESVRREYVDRRNFLIDALNKMEGVFCTKPKGAFYCIARLPIDDSDKFCQWLLESFEYNNETVMLAPATGFYATPGAGIDEVRLAYVLNKEDLKKAMNCLEKALQLYPGRTLKTVEVSSSTK